MDTDSGTDGKGAVKTEYGVVKTDLGTDGTEGVKTEHRVVKTESDRPNGVGKTESDSDRTTGVVKTKGHRQMSPSWENNLRSHSSASPQNIGLV